MSIIGQSVDQHKAFSYPTFCKLPRRLLTEPLSVIKVYSILSVCPTRPTGRYPKAFGIPRRTWSDGARRLKVLDIDPSTEECHRTSLSALWDDRLSTTGKRVWLALQVQARWINWEDVDLERGELVYRWENVGTCTVKVATLAEHLGVNRWAVRQGLKALEQTGYLMRQHQRWKASKMTLNQMPDRIPRERVSGEPSPSERQNIPQVSGKTSPLIHKSFQKSFHQRDSAQTRIDSLTAERCEMIERSL